MTTTEQALAGARRVARRAAQRDAGLAANPYPTDGTPVQRAAHRAWLRTYLHWRPAEVPDVDYGDELTAFAHGPDRRDQADAGHDPAAALAQGIVIDGGA
jgi:hypothetical protein